jgi:hypothetical protein
MIGKGGDIIASLCNSTIIIGIVFSIFCLATDPKGDNPIGYYFLGDMAIIFLIGRGGESCHTLTNDKATGYGTG